MKGKHENGVGGEEWGGMEGERKGGSGCVSKGRVQVSREGIQAM